MKSEIIHLLEAPKSYGEPTNLAKTLEEIKQNYLKNPNMEIVAEILTMSEPGEGSSILKDMLENEKIDPFKQLEAATLLAV